MKSITYLWPNRIIGKRESAQIRKDHNALATEHDELKRMLKTLVEMHESTGWSASKSFDNWQDARALLDKVCAE